jgi:hypothetical protein
LEISIPFFAANQNDSDKAWHSLLNLVQAYAGYLPRKNRIMANFFIY